MPPYSPRSGLRKTVETGSVLFIVALGITATFQAIREFGGVQISGDLEGKITAFLMASIGTGLKSLQHRIVYGKWW